MFMYENIDMKKTGLLLKTAIGNAGYTVKDIQKKMCIRDRLSMG